MKKSQDLELQTYSDSYIESLSKAPSSNALKQLLLQNESYVKSQLLYLTDKAIRNIEASLDTASTPSDLLASAEKLLSYLNITPLSRTQAREEGAKLASASIATALKSLASMFSVSLGSSVTQAAESKMNRKLVKNSESSNSKTNLYSKLSETGE